MTENIPYGKPLITFDDPLPEPSWTEKLGDAFKKFGSNAAQVLPYIAQGLNTWSQAEAKAAQTYSQNMTYTPLRSTRKPISVITTQGKTIQALQPREFKPHRLMADTLASLHQHDAEQALQRWQNDYHQTPSSMGRAVQSMGLPLPNNPSGQYSQNPNGGDVTTPHSTNMRAILDPAFYEQPTPKPPEPKPIRLSHREKSDYQEAREIQRRLRLFQQEPTYYDRLMLKRGTDVARKLLGTPQPVETVQTSPELLSYGFQDWKGAQFDVPSYGEQKIGRLSNSPVHKHISFETDQQLSDRVWEHFYQGEGQPAEINLRKLNFSQNVNIPNLLSRSARLQMLNTQNLADPKLKKTIQQNLQKLLKKPVSISGNGKKITYVDIQQPFVNVSLALPQWSHKWAVFGRVPMTLKNTELLINHEARTVTVTMELHPDSTGGLIEDFDFDPQDFKQKNGRSLEGEVLTRLVHHAASPGSTSFKLYAVRGTFSKFQRQYTFAEFLQ